MIDLKQVQKDIFQNKVDKGFPTDNVAHEINAAMKELGEVVEAYWRKDDHLDEEIADVIIFMLGLGEILELDIEEALKRKVEKNKRRQYVKNEKGILQRVRTDIDP